MRKIDAGGSWSKPIRLEAADLDKIIGVALEQPSTFDEELGISR
jgi:hypothetical protein